MEVEANVKLSDAQYESLRKMIESPDQQDNIVALHCLENCDQKESLGKILYLYKRAKFHEDLWTENAPKLWKRLHKLGIEKGEELTFMKAIKIITESKASIEHFEFLISRFASVISDKLNEWGYEFVDRIEIKIISKDVSVQ